MQIIVADDDRVNRLVISRLLEHLGHTVHAVEDGQEAWEAQHALGARFIISDWMMPRMDGLELCRRIRGAHLPYYVYFILMTVRNARSDLIEGMEAGADDFIAKPVFQKELEVRVRAGQRIMDLEQALEQRNRGLHDANLKLTEILDRLNRDLEAAARMQQSLLPRFGAIHSAVTLGWRFCPAAVVAGDHFNFFLLDEAHLGFYLLDVAGHGIPAAMLSITLSQIMTTKPAEGSPMKVKTDTPPGYRILTPAETVSELNRRFQGDDDTPYFTMIYGVLDVGTGVCRLCQAGHPSPLLVSANGDAQWIGGGGFPVGMLSDLDYEDLVIELAPGARLFLYSDGVTECANPAGELYGDDRLRARLAPRNEPLDEVLAGLEAELRAWRGADSFEDDISMLALELCPPS